MRPLGIINQPNTLFYKAISETKYIDELQKVSTDFKKHFDSILGQGIKRSIMQSWNPLSIFEMEKQVPIPENQYGVKAYADVVLSIFKD